MFTEMGESEILYSLSVNEPTLTSKEAAALSVVGSFINNTLNPLLFNLINLYERSSSNGFQWSCHQIK